MEQKNTSKIPDTDLFFYKLKEELQPIFKIAKRNLKKQSRPIYLEDIIGFGGFGVVAKGHTDLLLDGLNVENHPCAVKIVYPGRIYGDDPNVNLSNRTRFISEAFSARQVYINLKKLGNNLEKHIVRFYRYGEFDDTYDKNNIRVGMWAIRAIAKMYKKRYISWRYIVSEYFEAKELGQYKGIISIKDIVKVGRIICQVLEATHSLQLIHRDIKPTNILIPNGKIEDLKLCDFGLAKRTDVSIPVHRSILGSVGFAAPEQIDPKLTYPVDNRADIYGLAATLYFMITDHYPYNEKDAKLLMRKGKPIPRPKPLTDFVNQPELNEILSKALSPDRSNRYKNINEFKTDLDTIYNKL